jgi:hypothetical protein
LKDARSAFNLLAVISPIVFLYGCIGIGVLGVGDRSISTGKVPTYPYRTKLVSYEGEALSTYYVLSQWGEPNHRKQTDSNGEIWEYRGKNLRWHGVVPMLLLPLPLVIPFGHDYVTLVIKNDLVQSSETTDWNFTFGFYCGYAMFISEMKGKTILCEGGIK